MSPEGMIPLMGMVTGIITTGLFFWGIVQVARSQIGTAIARRLQGHAGTDPDLAGDVQFLREQLDSLQQRLTESEERLEFTERLLAQSRAQENLPKG